jgi:hypothetical protein
MTAIICPKDKIRPSRIVQLSGIKLVIQRHSVRVSAEKPVIMTEVFRGFPVSLRANTSRVPRSGHDLFLTNHDSSLTLLLDVIYSR